MRSFAALLIIGTFFSCTRDEPAFDTKALGYPAPISKLILTTCATQGCHTSKSKDATAGLSLSTWEEMMQGGNSGAVTIPYSSALSSTLLFTNTYASLGVSAKPTMPLYQHPLSESDVKMLMDWIDNGAPNNNGFVKFSDHPTRKKAYIVNQGCDNVAVVDVASNLIMRYISVGKNNNLETPHMVKISPDGKYWCVCFASGDVFQIFSTKDDKLLATVPLPAGSWNTITFSRDSKMVYTVDWNSSGRVACINLETKTLKKIIGNGALEWPHGIALLNDTAMYVSANKGNYMYRANIEDLDNVDFHTVVAEKNAALNKNSSLDIHEIVFSPDQSKYFLSCQTSNEVRVMDTQKDTLIAVISTGKYPVEFSFSEKNQLLFVSCMEDDTYINEGIKGSITVIDYTNNTKIATIKSGHQPHGLQAHDDKDLLYIVNRNIATDGPAPHHTSYCGGRNGYCQLIDMKTLKLIPGSKMELSADPYSIAIRQ